MRLHALLTVPGDADTRRRGRTLLIITLLVFILNLLRVPLGYIAGFDISQTWPATIVGIVGLGLPILLARRGWVRFAGWLVVLSGLIIISTTPLLRRELILPIVFLTIPVLFAALTLRPVDIWACLVLCLATLALCAYVAAGRTEWQGGTQVLIVVVASLLVTVAVLSFIGARATAAAFVEAAVSRQAAEKAAAELERLNIDLEGKVAAATAELRMALTEVETRAAQQQALLDEIAGQRETIREMSVPVLPVRHDALVVPIVGILDSDRIAELREQVLGAVERNRAHTVFLDITGVPMVDDQVARGLMETIQGARLLGAHPMLIGIRPEVAQALVSLGIDLSNLRTASDLESALNRVS